MGVKLTSKMGMAAATSLAGLAMMGAGSFALFTAHAASNTQTFAAGVVDVNVAGQGFQSFSNDHTIDFWNMVPGDYAGGYVVLKNTGTVNEIIDVHNHAHGPIFWDDGLNNGEVSTLPGFANGTLPSADSPVSTTAMGVYKNYWQPRLLGSGPQVVTNANGVSDWESVDYAATGNNSNYEFDNNPATYTVSYGIYSSFTGATFNSTDGSTSVQGTLAQSVVIPQFPVTYSFREAGWSPSTKAVYGWTSATSSQSFNGSSKVDGIVLAPGQYLVVSYKGQLPTAAHNDYQDAWGSLNVSFNAAQYENNHQGLEGPRLHTGGGASSSGGGSATASSVVDVALNGDKATASNLSTLESEINTYTGQTQTYNVTTDVSGTAIDFNFDYTPATPTSPTDAEVVSQINTYIASLS
ncbi:MAG: TasA family protein [Alicyclobacillaceae bacterium]|nr:TasA family protein [Alicyclobacillaceae bacterium]